MICSQAEVANFHVVLWVEEDVDRLQVPVNHALERTGNIRYSNLGFSHSYTPSNQYSRSIPARGCKQGRPVSPWKASITDSDPDAGLDLLCLVKCSFHSIPSVRNGNLGLDVKQVFVGKSEARGGSLLVCTGNVP